LFPPQTIVVLGVSASSWAVTLSTSQFHNQSSNWSLNPYTL